LAWYAAGQSAEKPDTRNLNQSWRLNNTPLVAIQDAILPTSP
jgi:hypothetical protein